MFFLKHPIVYPIYTKLLSELDKVFAQKNDYRRQCHCVFNSSITLLNWLFETLSEVY